MGRSASPRRGGFATPIILGVAETNVLKVVEKLFSVLVVLQKVTVIVEIVVIQGVSCKVDGTSEVVGLDTSMVKPVGSADEVSAMVVVLDSGVDHSSDEVSMGLVEVTAPDDVEVVVSIERDEMAILVELVMASIADVTLWFVAVEVCVAVADVVTRDVVACWSVVKSLLTPDRNPSFAFAWLASHIITPPKLSNCRL